jgi:bacillithiol biosynthesis cysteine-adding enzyme BshC
MEIRKISQHVPVDSGQESSLFEAYVNDFNNVKTFYQFNFLSDWDAAIQKRAGHKFERKKLTDILTAQNRKWEAPRAVLENISQLISPDCLAVVTGQQAGIFTGPLYTIYKIITAIKLSEWLKTEHPKYTFIPCFWLEVDDHDFKEINHIQFFTKENELHRLELSEEARDDSKPVYMRYLKADIAGWKSEIKDKLFQTEFMGSVLESFFEAYSSQSSFVDAFARLVLKFFGENGLVVMNPADPEVKKLGRPIYQKAIEAPEKIQHLLKNRNTALAQSQLPVQIQFHPEQTLLFYTDAKDQRVRIDFNEKNDFLLKYGDKYERLEHQKLISIIEESPERISPNVALRPLIQDSVLPTVGYVAGPAEVAYFAQVSTLYDHFEQAMPVIYPRHRMTIVESKIQKIIEKLGIDFNELFSHRSDFWEYFIQQKQGKNTFDKVAAIQSEISAKLGDLEKIVSEVDPTLINAIQKTGQKIDSGIELIMSKITNAIKQREAVEMDQVKRALLFVFPEDNYQERVINIIYFLIKYGPDLVSNLLQELPLDTRPHYLIYL